MPFRRADRRSAQRQAEWIVRLEPFRSLGYKQQRLAAWLGRQAQAGRVRAAQRGGATRGLVVVQSDFLLGCFIALLVVRPDAAGRGVGRALVAEAARCARPRRWLYASCDADNRAALRFYRRLGFERVGRLPDLVAQGRTEILLRRALRAGR